jgi:hypothetical protein
VAATVTIGRTTLATTGREHIPSGAGPLYFSLTSHARQLLVSRHGRLRVRITVRDISGMRATRIMTLDSFTTSGRSPTRNATQSPGLQVASMTDFVSHAWVGGILAACTAPNPCRVRATISSGGTVIATTGAQFVGVGELGYVLFTLTPAGHGLLVHARGNQLPVTVSLDDGTDVATAHVVLVSY